MSRAAKLKQLGETRVLRALAADQFRSLRIGVLLMFADKFGYGRTQLLRIDRWIADYCTAHFPTYFKNADDLSMKVSAVFIDAVNMVAVDKLHIGDEKGRQLADAFFHSMDGIGRQYVSFSDIEQTLKDEYGIEVKH